MPGQPTGVGQCPAQQELDLGVGAALFLAGPSGQGVVHGWIQPQQHTLAITHCLAALPAPSLVQRAGVDDRLGRLLAAQNDEQVGDHRGLALLVQLDDAFGVQPLQGQRAMPAATSAMRWRAPATALACCWRSMAWAISGA
jgi:hypothetical protein